jgi:hypothetical protein
MTWYGRAASGGPLGCIGPGAAATAPGPLMRTGERTRADPGCQRICQRDAPERDKTGWDGPTRRACEVPGQPGSSGTRQDAPGPLVGGCGPEGRGFESPRSPSSTAQVMSRFTFDRCAAHHPRRRVGPHWTTLLNSSGASMLQACPCPDTRQDVKCRARNRCMKVLGRSPRHGPQAGRVEPQHARPGRLHRLRWHGLGEHRRQQRHHQLLGRQLRQPQRLLQALLGDLGRQRATPPGVGRRQDQRPGRRSRPCQTPPADQLSRRPLGRPRPPS